TEWFITAENQGPRATVLRLYSVASDPGGVAAISPGLKRSDTRGKARENGPTPEGSQHTLNRAATPPGSDFICARNPAYQLRFSPGLMAVTPLGVNEQCP